MADRLHARLRVLPRALLRGLVTFGRRRRPSAPRRVLIAHHLLLGDTIMLTPLLAKLRQVYPAAEVIMTVPEPIAPIYAGSPYGTRVIPWDPRKAETLTPLFAG